MKGAAGGAWCQSFRLLWVVLGGLQRFCSGAPRRGASRGQLSPAAVAASAAARRPAAIHVSHGPTCPKADAWSVACLPCNWLLGTPRCGPVKRPSGSGIPPSGKVHPWAMASRFPEGSSCFLQAEPRPPNYPGT